MAITGRTAFEAAKTFTDHLNRVLSQTVTGQRLICTDTEPDRFYVSFRRDGDPVAAVLRTSHGPMEFFLAQRCDAVRTAKSRYRLRTLAYTYTLTVPGEPEPWVRWEYVRHREPSGAVWARHHVQGLIRAPLGASDVGLNDWHLPTGYVPVEDVLRFCLADLGVKPLREDWSEILEESYRRFREDFTADEP